MSALLQIKDLCDQISSSISNEQASGKLNKAAHGRMRIMINQVKKLATSAKAESMQHCKDGTPIPE